MINTYFNGEGPNAYQRVEVLRVDGDQVADDWAIYGPWIMATMEHDLEPIDAVETMRRLRGESWICLIANIDGELAGIAICALVFPQGGKALEVKALAGDSFDVWIDQMWHSIRATAASQNCKRVFLKGRMGWKKKLNRLGFKARAITMEYRING